LDLALTAVPPEVDVGEPMFLLPHPALDEKPNVILDGVPIVETATSVAEMNDVPVPIVPGKFTVGSAYLVPNPPDENGYPLTLGVVVCANTIASPDGENLGAATTAPPAGNVAGLENLVPYPVPDVNGYTSKKGDVVEQVTT
jgi:hypothetical protein